MRSGTLNVPGIVGFGKAAEIAARRDGGRDDAARRLARSLLDGLHKRLDEIFINGSMEHSAAAQPEHQLRLRRRRIAADGHQRRRGVVGSACTSALEPSYVLKALGLARMAHSSIRFGLGRWTTEEEIDRAIAHVAEVVGRLRAVAPVARASGRYRRRGDGVFRRGSRRACATRSASACCRTAPDVGTGEAGTLDEGTVVRIQVRVDGDRIAEARFKVFGCSAAIASASLVAEWLEGAPIAEAGR